MTNQKEFRIAKNTENKRKQIICQMERIWQFF